MTLIKKFKEKICEVEGENILDITIDLKAIFYVIEIYLKLTRNQFNNREGCLCGSWNKLYTMKLFNNAKKMHPLFPLPTF